MVKSGRIVLFSHISSSIVINMQILEAAKGPAPRKASNDKFVTSV